MIEFEQPMFRPPSEANSLLIQATIGCSHNNCTYCAMYRELNQKFRIRSEEEILQIIKENSSPTYKKAFIADGNALIIPTKVLLKKGSNGFTSKCIKLSNKIWLYAPKNAPVKDETTLISVSVLSHFNFAKLFSFCKLLFQNLSILSQIGIPIIAQHKAIIDDPINV